MYFVEIEQLIELLLQLLICLSLKYHKLQITVFKPKKYIWMLLTVCMYNIHFHINYTLIYFSNFRLWNNVFKTFTNKWKFFIWDLWFAENYLHCLMFVIAVYIYSMWSLVQTWICLFRWRLSDIRFHWKFHPTVNPVVKDGKQSGECTVFL